MLNPRITFFSLCFLRPSKHFILLYERCFWGKKFNTILCIIFQEQNCVFLLLYLIVVFLNLSLVMIGVSHAKIYVMGPINLLLYWWILFKIIFQCTVCLN